MSDGTYGLSITGGVAVLTLTVPVLWLLVIFVLAGLFLVWTTVRDWVITALTRVGATWR
jgi:hypothetical protein